MKVSTACIGGSPMAARTIPKRFKGGVSDLNTGGLDLQLSGRGRVLESSDITVLVGTTDLAVLRESR